MDHSHHTFFSNRSTLCPSKFWEIIKTQYSKMSEELIDENHRKKNILLKLFESLSLNNNIDGIILSSTIDWTRNLIQTDLSKIQNVIFSFTNVFIRLSSPMSNKSIIVSFFLGRNQAKSSLVFSAHFYYRLFYPVWEIIERTRE